VPVVSHVQIGSTRYRVGVTYRPRAATAASPRKLHGQQSDGAIVYSMLLPDGTIYLGRINPHTWARWAGEAVT
jgi:hypothetical protein